MKLDRGIVRARLAATVGDTGVFAAAYREHVPVLLAEVDRLTAELADEKERHEDTREVLDRVKSVMKAAADDVAARFAAAIDTGTW